MLIGGGVVVTALIVGVIAAVAYVLNVAQSAPAIGSLHQIIGGGSSQVYAADGTRLGFIQSDQLRTPVGWSQIPTDLKNATVAIEDQRFYKNNGIDLTGIFRAAVKDVTHGKALQGGSTITMQLMRNLYLGGDQHTIKQKIIEAKLAIEYEKRHGKRSILTSYLNSVPYGTLGGQTAIGVQAASRIFFDKPAAQLNLQQSALLAGLPQAPSQYNPFRDAGEAKRRRNEVLSKMAQLHYISGAQADAAEAAPLEVKRGYFYSERKEDFFFEYVRQKLVERYGKETVAQGGLKVHTTIDLDMQRKARRAIAEVLNEPEDPAAAIVTIDPANGNIEAMAESQSYEQSQYNLAAQGHRQPGSTFKAIVYGAALEQGFAPNRMYNDAPVEVSLAGHPGIAVGVRQRTKGGRMPREYRGMRWTRPAAKRRASSGPVIVVGRAMSSRTMNFRRSPRAFLSRFIVASSVCQRPIGYVVGSPSRSSTRRCRSTASSLRFRVSRESSAANTIPIAIAAPCRHW